MQINDHKRDRVCSLPSLISSVAEKKVINQVTSQKLNYPVERDKEKSMKKYDSRVREGFPGKVFFELGYAEWVTLNCERGDSMYKGPGTGKTWCFWITKTEIVEFKRYLGVKIYGSCNRLYLEGDGSSKNDIKIFATGYVCVAFIR